MAMLRVGLYFTLGVIFVYLASEKLRQPARDQGAARELQQAKEELRQLQRTVQDRPARSDRQAVVMQQLATASSTESVPVEAAPQRSASASAVPAQLTDEDVQVAMETHFAAQPQDSSWSPQAEERVSARIKRDADTSSSLRWVRCSSVMCRIETAHQDLDAYHRFVEETFIKRQTALWNGGFFSKVIETAPDGKVTVVSFLAREQQGLPDVSRM